MTTSTTNARTIAGRQIHLKALPQADALPITQHAETALTVADDLGTKSAAILGDRNLSSVGQEAKLTPLRTQAVLAVTSLAAALDEHAARVDQREAKMLAVPPITDAHSAAVDIEIRTWWRQLPLAERTAMLEKFGATDDHNRIELALLRSPIALADHELKVIRAGWDEGARIEHMAEALDIAAERRAIAWTHETLLHAAAVISSLVGRNGLILETIAAASSIHADGAWVFDIAAQTIAEAKRAAAVRKIAMPA